MGNIFLISEAAERFGVDLEKLESYKKEVFSSLDTDSIIKSYEHLPSGYGMMTGLIGISYGIRYLRNKELKIKSFDLELL